MDNVPRDKTWDAGETGEPAESLDKSLAGSRIRDKSHFSIL